MGEPRGNTGHDVLGPAYSLVHVLCQDEVGIKQTECPFFPFQERPPLPLICNPGLLGLRKPCTEDILFDSELHHSKR